MNVEELLALAEQGVPQAQNDLGLAYIMGNGVNIDEVEATKWLAKAVDQQLPSAFANLGRCYLEGVGVERNVEAALSLFAKAVGFDMLDVKDYIAETLSIDELSALANANNPQAQYFLGLLYIDGKKVGQNSEMAIRLFEKAAFNSNPEPMALLWISQMNEKGIWYSQNLLRAEKLIKVATETGCYVADLYAKDLRHKIAETSPFILCKIIPECSETGRPKDQYVQDLLAGNLFMRTLDQFGSAKLLNNNFRKTLGDRFRGDYLEGIDSSRRDDTPLFGENFDSFGFGQLDILRMREKLYCMTAIEYDAPYQRFYNVDSRLSDFGEYAVIVTDVEEFLRRVTIALDKLCKKWNDKFWLGYQRVIYNVDLRKKQGYGEFCKTWDYSWQKEFRIVLDMANGKFYPYFILRGEERKQYIEKHIKKENFKNADDYERTKQWLLGYPEPTDWSLHTLPGKIEIDTNPDSIKDFFYFEIGDISDICVSVLTSELIECTDVLLLLSDKFKPPILTSPNIPPREPKPTFFFGVF